MTAVIILKSTHNYKCDCKCVNSVLLVSQHNIQVEEPKYKYKPYKTEEPSTEHSSIIEPIETEPHPEVSYDPDMKLIFASNILFANSTKNNSSIFEQQIHIKLSIQSMDFHTYSQ